MGSLENVDFGLGYLTFMEPLFPMKEGLLNHKYYMKSVECFFIIGYRVYIWSNDSGVEWLWSDIVHAHFQ